MNDIKLDIDHKEDNRFYISPSTIPKAGFGLFAKKTIEKGEKLYVFGIRIKLNSDLNICTGYARNYKFADPEDENYCIMPVSYAGMINQDPQNFNATIKNDGKNVYFEFIRDIIENEEIFTYYGDGWCNVDNKVMAFIRSKILAN
jgi:hypothetical protein